MDKAEVIDREQQYFDQALEARDRSLAGLDLGAANAANPKAAADLRRMAKAKRVEADGDGAVAEGRFDDESGVALYIGKHAIWTADNDVLVVNWQAPAAQPYYDASVSDPCGVVLKRAFETDRNRIIDFDDLVLADLLDQVRALDGRTPEPSFDDALLRDLDRVRTGEMQDIVKTIQAAQHALIRVPLDTLLVVQGGPGTGKTAIALHRVSWLLYNYADQLDDGDVLVVGPNPTFSRYIRALLPSLGDVNIVQQNLIGLGPVRSHRRPEEPSVAALKGDGRMEGLLPRALTARVRIPAEADGVFEVNTRAGTARVPNAGLIDALNAALAVSTYAQGRGQVRTYLSETLAQLTPGTLGATPQQVDAALDRVWPSLTSAVFLRELLGSRDRLFEAAGHAFTAEEAGRLYRQSADRVSEETWSDADVALLDEAEALINGEPSRYRHVVVDEAQDLSPMQLRSLRRRSNGSMTVVGDMAQSTGAFARSSWEEISAALAQDHPVQLRDLEYGYRVPRQVMDMAARLLPVAAPDIVPPTVVRDAPEDPRLLDFPVEEHAEQAVIAARDYAGHGLSVGIVCPSQSRHLLLEELERQKVKWNDGTSGALGQGINLVSPVDAKGLEFDAVVVLSPHVIVEEDVHGYRLLYIALTRTTRYLTVVHDGDPLALSTRGGADQGTSDVGPAQQTLPMEGSPVVAEQLLVPVEPQPALVRATPEAAGEPQPPGPRSKAVHAAVLAAAADSLAAEVRDALPEALWAQAVNELRLRLNVSADAMLDLLE